MSDLPFLGIPLVQACKQINERQNNDVQEPGEINKVGALSLCSVMLGPVNQSDLIEPSSRSRSPWSSRGKVTPAKAPSSKCYPFAWESRLPRSRNAKPYCARLPKPAKATRQANNPSTLIWLRIAPLSPNTTVSHGPKSQIGLQGRHAMIDGAAFRDKGRYTSI